jgi:hypothetical protein
MTKLICLASFVVGAGCIARTPSIGIGASAGGGIPGPPPPPPDVVAVDSGDPGPDSSPELVGNRAPGEDLHWFTADDYLVSREPYDKEKLSNVRVAKMTAAASGQTKSEARFLIANGDEMWTASFWRTRVATSADFRVGALAFCNDVSWSKSSAPKTKHQSRQEQWILAAITDTADTYKGRITVGDVSCAVDGVRVPIR